MSNFVERIIDKAIEDFDDLAGIGPDRREDDENDDENEDDE